MGQELEGDVPHRGLLSQMRETGTLFTCLDAVGSFWVTGRVDIIEESRKCGSRPQWFKAPKLLERMEGLR